TACALLATPAGSAFADRRRRPDGSVQHPRAQRPLDLVERRAQARGDLRGRGDVDHHVADLGVGAQELAVDVDALAREQLVDAREYAGDVAMDVQDAVA